MTPEQAAQLRAPFPANAIGKIPKGGQMLDYVGHAAATDRLLQVDPEWTWEPPTAEELKCLPAGDGMWIKLTVAGVTRFGWGDGKNIKEWISDAIRNAAMRFGVALDLWTKEDLHANENGTEQADSAWSHSGNVRSSQKSAIGEPVAATSKARREKLKSRCVALQADGVSVADAREERHLPVVDSCDETQLAEFEGMVLMLEAELEAPFVKADA